MSVASVPAAPHRTHARRRRLRRRRLAVFAAAIVLPVCLVLFFAHALSPRSSPPYRIAVDAGHGGGDTGAIGVVQESDLTAQTADALIALLEADPNFIVVRTRDTYDTAAKPSERAAQANRGRADLLLSIHGNADTSAETQGFECYPVTPGRRQHDASLRFAGLLAAQMESAGAHLRAQNGIRYAYYDAAGQKTLVDSSDDTVRAESTFTILENSRCPAVLAEQCFVTSSTDVDAFGDADGCALAAACYYRAICAYFGTEPGGV